MQIEELARCMRARVPWDVARRVLAELNVPRGQGWDSTVSKLLDRDAVSAESLSALEDRYREHLLCGEKLFQVFDLTEEQMTSLRAALIDYEIEDNDFSAAYPGLVSEDVLSRLRPSGPVLVAVENREDGVAAVFSSVRIVEVREPLAFDEVPEEAQHLFNGYSEVLGIRTVKTQAYDVVWVPSNGTRVDVRVDFPNGGTQDLAIAAHAAVRNALNEVVGMELLSTARNLFPLIEHIYSAEGDGIVVEFGLITTTGSLKQEKMRRRNVCLRTETYHKGGSDAVDGQLELFKISVEWRRPLDVNLHSKPELTLHGSSRMLHSSSPVLYEAVLRKCTGLSDFEFVRAKIDGYLEALSG